MTAKRKHRRIPISAVATVTFEDKGKAGSVQTMASSISYGGIGLYSDDRIEDETDVTVTVHFVSTAGVIITETLTGTVVYNREIGQMYFVGIQFDEEMTAANHPALYRHIEQVLSLDNA